MLIGGSQEEEYRVQPEWAGSNAQIDMTGKVYETGAILCISCNKSFQLPEYQEQREVNDKGERDTSK